MVQHKRIPLGTMKLWVQSLAFLSGLRIWHCCELWCRSQTRWLVSCISVAVVQANSCSSYLTPSLGTSICHECGPKKQKQKQKKTIKQNKKKKQARDITPPDFSKYYKAIVIQRGWYWDKKKTYTPTEQNREPRCTPRQPWSLIFDKRGKNIKLENFRLFSKGCQ